MTGPEVEWGVELHEEVVLGVGVKEASGCSCRSIILLSYLGYSPGKRGVYVGLKKYSSSTIREMSFIFIVENAFLLMITRPTICLKCGI